MTHTCTCGVVRNVRNTYCYDFVPLSVIRLTIVTISFHFISFRSILPQKQMAETVKFLGNNFPIMEMSLLEGEITSLEGNIPDDVYFLFCSCIDHLSNGKCETSANIAEELLEHCWEWLNSSHWKDVKPCWRKAYSLASVIKVHSILISVEKAHKEGSSDLATLLKVWFDSLHPFTV